MLRGCTPLPEENSSGWGCPRTKPHGHPAPSAPLSATCHPIRYLFFCLSCSSIPSIPTSDCIFTTL